MNRALGKGNFNSRTNKTSRTLNSNHVTSVVEGSHLNTRPNAKPAEQHAEVAEKIDTSLNAVTVLKLPMSKN